MLHTICPNCKNAWSRLRKVKIETISTENMSDQYSYTCTLCKIYYYPFDNEIISKCLGNYEIEWDYSEGKTSILYPDVLHTSYLSVMTFDVLFPLDLTEDKLKVLLTFS